MFSKSRINEPGPKSQADEQSPRTPEPMAPRSGAPDYTSGSSTPKAKPPASILSADLTVVGNLKTSGDIQVEGTVEGDIRAHLLTVGESATIRGEVMADDVVVNGRIVGRVRGLKVRLTSTARVEGDIIHKTIAIESGAHFEGSVQRQEDPLNAGASRGAPGSSPSTSATSGAKSSAPAPSKDSAPASSSSTGSSAGSQKPSSAQS